MATSDPKTETFKDFEKVSWNRQAEHYDGFAGQMTRYAVDALLTAVQPVPGTKLLDVATGPGYVAAEAARRGADAIGIDIAENMLQQARQRFPDITYTFGDAESLSYETATFDAVVCGFGMLHFPRPGKAVAEAYRVLRPGGRYAFTVWDGPSNAKLLALVADVVRQHADSTVTLPPGPGLFMLSDPWVATAMMEAARFTNVTVAQIPCFFMASSPETVFEFMRKGMVRATYVYDRSSAEVQRAIEEGIKKAAAAALASGGGRIACPYLLISGTKAI